MYKKIVSGVIVAGLTFAMAPSVGATMLSPSSVSTKASDYSTKKKNQFWRVVTKYDPILKYVPKRDIISLGVSTCDLLRAGGDLDDLAMLLVDSNSGDAEESLMVIIAGAPIVLCPDQQYKFD